MKLRKLFLLLIIPGWLLFVRLMYTLLEHTRWLAYLIATFVCCAVLAVAWTALRKDPNRFHLW